MNIIVAGVGGQGNVLASRLIASAAIMQGMEAKTAETIGMAQRGGCVASHIRIGSEYNSPIVPDGAADLVIGFEVAETARNIYKLREGGRAIVNMGSIRPAGGMINLNHYNEDEVYRFIQNHCPDTVYIDAFNIAKYLGNSKVINVIMIGAAVAIGLLPFTQEHLENVLRHSLPKKYLDVNLRAFREGAHEALTKYESLIGVNVWERPIMELQNWS